MAATILRLIQYVVERASAALARHLFPQQIISHSQITGKVRRTRVQNLRLEIRVIVSIVFEIKLIAYF